MAWRNARKYRKAAHRGANNEIKRHVGEEAWRSKKEIINVFSGVCVTSMAA